MTHTEKHAETYNLCTPVSYTHLDVYKRQVCVCVCACVCKGKKTSEVVDNIVLNVDCQNALRSS